MFVCLWMVSRIETSAARPGLFVLSFCTGFHLSNRARERSKPSEI